MHMPLGDYHVITGPSVLLWRLASGFELVITTRCIADCDSKTRSCGHVVVHKPVRNWQESIFCSTIRFTFHFGVWWKSHIFDFFEAYCLWKFTILWEKKYLVKWNAHAIRWLPCHYWSKSAVVGVSVGLCTGDNSVHCRRDWVKLVLVGMWWFTNLSEIGRSRYFVQPLGLRFILGYDENRIFLTFLKPIVFGNLRLCGKKNSW